MLQGKYRFIGIVADVSPPKAAIHWASNGFCSTKFVPQFIDGRHVLAL